jgi:hypothetical protein
MINFKHVLPVIIFVSILSGCISQPVPYETSIPTVIPTATMMVENWEPGYASTSASIYIESSAENITIYVPVLLDEKKNVLKMYDTPAITGNVTTSIVDTEHGKALKISKSGQLNIYEGKNEIDFQEQHGKLNGDKLTSDEFFRRFTISMSNYTSPEHFIDMPYDEYNSKDRCMGIFGQ